MKESPLIALNKTLIFTVIGLSLSPASAQIVTDGSMGIGTSLQGPRYTIQEQFGTRVGDNLFHSFHIFNLSANESALFTGSNDIHNVVSRVTGGEPSQLFGSLRSNVGNADFYFINPAGVVFGERAKVDVPGSFYLSTAKELVFADGAVFSSDLQQASTLTVAAPSSFGFLGENAAAVTFQNTNAHIKTGGDVQIIAGDLDITDSRLRITADETRIHTVGTQAGSIAIDASKEALLNASNQGTLNIHNSELKLEEPSPSSLAIVAGQVVLSQSEMVINNIGDAQNETALFISANDVDMFNSRISVQAKGTGSSGNIDIHADNLSMTATENNRSEITVESRPGAGDAGDIIITLSEALSMKENSFIRSATAGSGRGADIKILADRITIDTADSQASAAINTFTGGAVKGGNIELDVTNAVSLIGNSQLNASTLGDGDAGDIIVNAGSMLIEETQSFENFQDENDSEIRQADTRVGIQSLSGQESDLSIRPQGGSGNITLNITGNLELRNGATIASVTIGDGDAGNITITADNLLLGSGPKRGGNVIGSNTLGNEATGNAASINILLSGMLEMRGNSFITTLSGSRGNAGNINIHAHDVAILGNGGISRSGIASSTEALNSTGSAGDINISAINSIVLQAGATVTSETRNSGDAGNINMSGQSLFVKGDPNRRETKINTSSKSNHPQAGDAGNVILDIAGDISFIGSSEITTESESAGNAGNIIISAHNLTLRGSELESKSEGENGVAGLAGDITINLTGDLNISDGGSVASGSFNGGDAGDINITAENLVMGGFGREFEFSELTSTAALGDADAGDINLNIHQSIVLRDGASIISDSLIAGKAGEININTTSLQLLGGGLPTRISSTSISGNGDAGQINIFASDEVLLTNGGTISSSTLGSQGNAGQVYIETDNLTIDGAGNQSLDEYLRIIALQFAEEFDELPEEYEEVPDEDEILLLSAYFDVLTENRLETGLSSISAFDATGNAGLISVDATRVTLLNGGVIDTSAYAQGNAGDISISTEVLDIQDFGFDNNTGIFSASVAGSGLAGTINIDASRRLFMNGGSIAVDSLVQDVTVDIASVIGTINIATGQLSMTNLAEISSSSLGNVAAANININSHGRVTLDEAQISTSAENADAGSIHLSGSDITLNNSIVTTSVSEQGNGGDIFISGQYILLDTGFIQGNTAGDNSAGGNITIESDFLIASNKRLVTSSDTRQAFIPNSGINVIQAAAPDGVSGNVNIGALEFDLSGELAKFNSALLQTDDLQNNPCTPTTGSSLGQSGKGALPITVRNYIAATSIGMDDHQVDRIKDKPSSSPTLLLTQANCSSQHPAIGLNGAP